MDHVEACELNDEAREPSRTRRLEPLKLSTSQSMPVSPTAGTLPIYGVWANGPTPASHSTEQNKDGESETAESDGGEEQGLAACDEDMDTLADRMDAANRTGGPLDPSGRRSGRESVESESDIDRLIAANQATADDEKAATDRDRLSKIISFADDVCLYSSSLPPLPNRAHLVLWLAGWGACNQRGARARFC